ncbi:MAG: carboxylesterase family protein [Tannerellaceae bacterium]|jgi:para-nitrobenzyl esterase|nr:carboxylesterase family protein [Tannerellaceae bacterium]
MFKQIIVATALLLLPLSSCRNALQTEATPVTTRAGLVSGTVSDDGQIRIFRGIPFAAPPVGDLRWREPQPPAPWEGVRACTIPPASAMQAKPVPFNCWSSEFLIPPDPISEDCLYLNVWTPAGPGDRLPVMVWIHGGGFTGGSGTVPLYDGEAIARKGIVYVTINYRLGIFGFLAHPELSAESPQHLSGNYGLLDQVAALRWVQENIAGFGGDPAQVCIAGQSAGAFSVNMLMASPLTRGLFARAIAQSGGTLWGSRALGQTLPDAEERGRRLVDRLGLTIPQMRALPADSLLKLPSANGFVIDSLCFPSARSVFEAGLQHKVPLLTGWNEGDGVSFGPSPSAASFRAAAEMQYGDRAGQFLRLFPAETDLEAAASQKLVNALFFGWNNYALARFQSAACPSFLYYFRRTPPGEPNYGSFHSAEFAYALHTLNYWERPFTEVDRRLEEAMSSYWTNFVKHGDPNGASLPPWPAFDPQNPQVMELGDEVKAGTMPAREQLEWNF